MAFFGVLKFRLNFNMSDGIWGSPGLHRLAGSPPAGFLPDLAMRIPSGTDIAMENGQKE